MSVLCPCYIEFMDSIFVLHMNINIEISYCIINSACSEGKLFVRNEMPDKATG